MQQAAKRRTTTSRLRRSAGGGLGHIDRSSVPSRSDSESSDSSYDSARSIADRSRCSSLDLESPAAVAAQNALSSAKYGLDIYPSRLRVLRVKLFCILVSFAVSSITSLRFLESVGMSYELSSTNAPMLTYFLVFHVGMFKSKTLPATTVKESFLIYSSFVSNESQKVLRRVDQQHETSLAEVQPFIE